MIGISRPFRIFWSLLSCWQIETPHRIRNYSSFTYYLPVKHICIITTRHISYNPRVLKEADALHKAGYKVTVVTVNYQFQPGQFDEQIMASRQWTLKTVNFRKEIRQEKMRWFRLSLKQKLFALLSKFTLKYGIVERATNKAYDALISLAAKTRADLYIAHHPEALGIGYKAAKRVKAKFAFDAEDFHTGMNKSPLSPAKEEVYIEYMERKYLPFCDYTTAASKGIGEAYAEKYGISLPTTILNSFPNVPMPHVQSTNSIVKFYWYSQVIGPNRNLEFLLKAASAIPMPFEIHLRGDFHSGDYKAGLESLARELGIESKIHFHAPILAEDIISDAMQFDIGIALELKDFMNSNLCVSNKTFAYLMAGLAIIGNDTIGQKDIFSHFPDAASICNLNDVSSLTSAMQYYIENPEQLARAKRLARKAAIEEFNWELESEKFLSCVKRSLKEESQFKQSYHAV